jgi:hypothetical protein
MSPQESAFVKMYAAALKQEYDLFMSALCLMGDNELAIKCPVQAAAAAQELQMFQAEFDLALASLANKHALRNKDVAARPSLRQFIQLIQLSFFRLVETDKQHKNIDDKGWFSGQPFDWEKTWEKVAPIKSAQELENVLTSLLKATLHFFSSYGKSQPPSKWPEGTFYMYPGDNDENEDEDEDYDNYEDDFDAPH